MNKSSIENDLIKIKSSLSNLEKHSESASSVYTDILSRITKLMRCIRDLPDSEVDNAIYLGCALDISGLVFRLFQAKYSNDCKVSAVNLMLELFRKSDRMVADDWRYGTCRKRFFSPLVQESLLMIISRLIKDNELKLAILLLRNGCVGASVDQEKPSLLELFATSAKHKSVQDDTLMISKTMKIHASHGCKENIFEADMLIYIYAMVSKFSWYPRESLYSNVETPPLISRLSEKQHYMELCSLIGVHHSELKHLLFSGLIEHALDNGYHSNCMKLKLDIHSWYDDRELTV